MGKICRSVLRIHSVYVKEEYGAPLLRTEELAAAFDGAHTSGHGGQTEAAPAEEGGTDEPLE